MMGANNKKRDDSPRGTFRRGNFWAIRFTCGAGCSHEEGVSPLKGDAIRTHAARRSRALSEPGWCPRTEREQARAKAKEEAAQQKRRQTFKAYAENNYAPWAAAHTRGWRKTGRFMVPRLVEIFGDHYLEDITSVEVESFLGRIIEDGKSKATRNRYRDLLSGMLKRAARHGLVPKNPVVGIMKFKEPGGRLSFVGLEEERAIHDALPDRLKPAFVVALNTGLRWSEQHRLRWRDIDVLTNAISVVFGKNGESRSIPMNARARGAMLDLAAGRRRPDDPDEVVFPLGYRRTNELFSAAVSAAMATLRREGKDASRLQKFTWHGLRHTFASRLVMAGVDLRTLMELGGWKTFSMVLRYSHLSPAHLRDAVDRIGPARSWTKARPSGEGDREPASMK